MHPQLVRLLEAGGGEGVSLGPKNAGSKIHLCFHRWGQRQRLCPLLIKGATTLDFLSAAWSWVRCELWPAGLHGRLLGYFLCWSDAAGQPLLPSLLPAAEPKRPGGHPVTSYASVSVSESVFQESEPWECDTWPAGSLTPGPLPVFPVCLGSSAAWPTTLWPHQTLRSPNTRCPLELWATLCTMLPRILFNTHSSCYGVHCREGRAYWKQGAEGR